MCCLFLVVFFVVESHVFLSYFSLCLFFRSSGSLSLAKGVGESAIYWRFVSFVKVWSCLEMTMKEST